MPPPETVVFDIDEQVEHAVHRQPGERRADTERVDVDLREHGRARVVEVRRCGQSAFPVGGVGRLDLLRPKRRTLADALLPAEDTHDGLHPFTNRPEFPEISRQNFGTHKAPPSHADCMVTHAGALRISFRPCPC